MSIRIMPELTPSERTTVVYSHFTLQEWRVINASIVLAFVNSGKSFTSDAFNAIMLKLPSASFDTHPVPPVPSTPSTPSTPRVKE